MNTQIPITSVKQSVVVEASIERAFKVFRDNPGEWDTMRRRVMDLDYSWKKSAAEYVELYKDAITRAQARIGAPAPEAAKTDGKLDGATKPRVRRAAPKTTRTTKPRARATSSRTAVEEEERPSLHALKPGPT